MIRNDNICIGIDIFGREHFFRVEAPHFSLNARSLGLVELKLCNNIKEIFCNDNQLTELVIPENVNYLRCDNNELKRLITKKKLRHLYCNYNYIEYLEIHYNDLITLDYTNNNFESDKDSVAHKFYNPKKDSFIITDKRNIIIEIKPKCYLLKHR